ncbi:MAG: hypothetical protein P1U63_03940 [Coxiellaceae bacterium]|nr:hypothetical protein [Coxiellaceae bacterium]
MTDATPENNLLCRCHPGKQLVVYPGSSYIALTPRHCEPRSGAAI